MPSANCPAWPTEIRLNPAQDVLTVAFDDGARFELARRISAGGIAQRRSARPWRAQDHRRCGKEDVKISGAGAGGQLCRAHRL